MRVQLRWREGTLADLVTEWQLEFVLKRTNGPSAVKQRLHVSVIRHPAKLDRTARSGCDGVAEGEAPGRRRKTVVAANVAGQF